MMLFLKHERCQLGCVLRGAIRPLWSFQLFVLAKVIFSYPPVLHTLIFVKRLSFGYTVRQSFSFLTRSEQPQPRKDKVNTTYGYTPPAPAWSGRLKDQPAGERPRERLIERGAAALSPAELIAILVRTGLRGTNALDIGKQLVQKFGSLGAMAKASVDELQCIRGIGRDKAVTLVAAFTLASKITTLNALVLLTIARLCHNTTIICSYTSPTPSLHFLTQFIIHFTTQFGAQFVFESASWHL
jgi:hypothetical protein